MASKAEEAAVTRAREMILATVDEDEGVEADVSAETPDVPSVPEAAAAPEAHEAAPAEPVVVEEPELPDEVRLLIEEPDFDAEAEAELAAEREERPEEDYEYTDPALESERKARLKAEKRAAYLEGLRTKDNRGRWKDEAAKYFPYAAPLLDDIDVASRRSFLREAKRLNDKLAPGVKAFLEREAAQVRQTKRAEAEEAWGTPTVAPGGPPSEAAELQDKIEKARARGVPLHELVKLRGEAGLNV